MVSSDIRQSLVSVIKGFLVAEYFVMRTCSSHSPKLLSIYRLSSGNNGCVFMTPVCECETVLYTQQWRCGVRSEHGSDIKESQHRRQQYAGLSFAPRVTRKEFPNDDVELDLMMYVNTTRGNPSSSRVSRGRGFTRFLAKQVPRTACGVLSSSQRRLEVPGVRLTQ